jgi:hypothetical protein
VTLPLTVQAESASIPAITPKNDVHTPGATLLLAKGFFEAQFKKMAGVVIAWRNEFHLNHGGTAKGLPGHMDPGARTGLLWEA